MANAEPVAPETIKPGDSPSLRIETDGPQASRCRSAPAQVLRSLIAAPGTFSRDADMQFTTPIESATQNGSEQIFVLAVSGAWPPALRFTT